MSWLRCQGWHARSMRPTAEGEVCAAAWQKIVRWRNAAFLRRKPLIREVAPTRASAGKLGASTAPAARRCVAPFTAMKRFVNSVSVVWHANVSKDCRHGVASPAQRHCLRAHPPHWVAGAGCMSRLCAPVGTSARLLSKLRSAGGTRRNVALLGYHRQPGPASVVDLERRPL